MPANLIEVEITLGLKDEQPTRWGGSVQVSEGRVVSLQVVGGGPNAKVNGNRFTARSIRRMMAIAGPKLLVSLDAPPTATVTVNTAQGEFKFALAELSGGAVKKFLDGRASAEQQAGALRLTGPETEDDYPAMAKGGGRHGLAGLRRLPAGQADPQRTHPGRRLRLPRPHRATAIRSG